MEQTLVQDYIWACQELDREAFCKRLDVPVLISDARRLGLSFGRGQTVLTRVQKKTPLARDLIRQGRQLPVVLLRQRASGPHGQIRLGRSAENDIVLTDETVSSRHAMFQLSDKTGTCSLHDLASMNGTRVNGSRLVVGKTVVLFDGDVLAFGDSIFLFFYPVGLFEVLRANFDYL